MPGAYQPRRRKQSPGLFMIVIPVMLVAIVILGLYWVFTPNQTDSNTPVSMAGSDGTEVAFVFGDSLDKQDDLSSRSSTQDGSNAAVVYNVTAGIADDVGTLTAPAVLKSPIPSDIELIQYIYSGMKKIQTFGAEPSIQFTRPTSYQTIPGLLTFRGNPYRSAPSWGFANPQIEEIEQVWEYKGIGELPSGDGTFNWKGTGWTGQPLVVQWPSDTLRWMNIFPEKKAKPALKEVIIAALDGKIYFLDFDDGTPTRPPIYVGATMKCTPTIDPRGYPLLFVGQGDNNSEIVPEGKTKANTANIWIYSLLDGSQLYKKEGFNDERAFRISWGCADSSPIVVAESDMLLYPSENGLLYAYRLNSHYDAVTGSLSISPETESYAFSYLVDGQTAPTVGIESSIAVYNHYAYWTDNNGYLVCLDLKTFTILWMKRLGDQSDVTPVIEEVDGEVHLYVSTKVESQRTDVSSYVGMAYTYKFNALTGDILWQTSFPAYSDAEFGQGGSFGTPVLGKNSIDDLVIFPYCRTVDEKQGSHLVAFDKVTGIKVWDYAMSSVSWCSPVDCYRQDGKAYIVMTDSLGQIHLVDGQTGQRIDYIQLMSNKGTDTESKSGLAIESTPAIFNGRIIVGTRSGSVFAADLM